MNNNSPIDNISPYSAYSLGIGIRIPQISAITALYIHPINVYISYTYIRYIHPNVD